MIIRNSAKIIKEQCGLSVSIIGVDNVPFTQEYDEASDTWFPDWTLLPLIITADIKRDDGSQVADSDISTKAWYIINSDGSETQIASTTPGFELFPSGYPLGLKINRNISVDAPISVVFRFRALGFSGMAQESIRAINNPAPTPDLEIDFPTASVWNPFETDRDVVTVTPTVRDYGKTSLSVEWLKRDGANWRSIDPSDPKDAELTIDAATNAVTIDRRWMGESISLVCRLIDNSGSNPVILRERPLTIRRRIPEYNAEILMASTFSEKDASVMAQSNVRIGKTKISDPSKELKLTWYNGNTIVGEGNKHSFPTGKSNAIDVGLDISDRGPMKLFTFNGAYLTINGKLIGGR